MATGVSPFSEIMCRVLWLDWDEGYVTQRMQQAAHQLGIQFATCEINDLQFRSAGGSDKNTGVSGIFDGNSAIDLRQQYDVLIARTFFPRISEALTVARLFKEAGKVVIDQSLTDQGYVVSKMHDYLLLAEQGIPVPRSWQGCGWDEAQRQAEALGYPCVLKAVHGSYGNHVHLARNVEELRRKWQRYPIGDLILQEYLPATEDFRIVVIGYQALPVFVGRRPKPGDFRTNFELGGVSEQYDGGANVQYAAWLALAERAARVLRREFAGVDLRICDGQPVILEVNRRPSFQNFEQTTGCDIAGAFLAYVRQRWEETHRQ